MLDVLTPMLLKIDVYWNVTPCSLGSSRWFRGSWCLQLQELTIIVHNVRNQSPKDTKLWISSP